MTKRRRITDLMLHELRVQMGAEHYSVAAFRGAGVYARGKTNTFQEAVALARRFITNRPVTIYAVRGQHQSHVINLDTREQEIRMAYLVIYSHYLKNLEIATYAEKKMAQAALESITDPAVSGLAVEVDADIVGSNQLIADMFNALHTVDDPSLVQRFSSKNEGQRRLLARIEARAKGQPVLSIEVAPTEVKGDASSPASTEKENKDMATKKKAKKTKKAPAAAAGGKRSRIDKDAKINVLAEKNPLREGSAAWERFKLFRTGQTVKSALEKGVWPADIRWCVKKKFIALVKS